MSCHSALPDGTQTTHSALPSGTAGPAGPAPRRDARAGVGVRVARRPAPAADTSAREQYLRNLRRYKLYPDCTASGSPGRVYESLQQEVDFCMSEGAKEALLRGQVEEPRPAPLTCKIGEVATIRIK